MAGWHLHCLDGHESEQTLGDGKDEEAWRMVTGAERLQTRLLSTHAELVEEMKYM